MKNNKSHGRDLSLDDMWSLTGRFASFVILFHITYIHPPEGIFLLRTVEFFSLSSGPPSVSSKASIKYLLITQKYPQHFKIRISHYIRLYLNISKIPSKSRKKGHMEENLLPFGKVFFLIFIFLPESLTTLSLGPPNDE
jgi:hypothetical protein